jgi:tetratricopeptide (TPR) repeat protein
LRVDGETALVVVTEEIGQPDQAKRWLAAAEATLRRTSDEGEARARWLEAAGTLARMSGRFDEAVDRYREGLDTVRRSGVQGVLVGNITLDLATALVSQARYDEATKLIDDYDREVVRVAGEDHPIRVHVYNVRSWIASGSNDPRAELQYARQEIALGLRVAPSDSTLPDAFNMVCDASIQLGEFAESLADCTRGVAEAERFDGPLSRRAAGARVSLGEDLVGLKRYEEAATAFEAAASAAEGSGAKAFLAAALVGLGNAQLEEGKPRDAVATLERAASMEDRLFGASAVGDEYRGKERFGLARALWSSGTRSARPVAVARSAAEAFRLAGDEGRAAEVDSWLASKHVPPR